MRTPGDGPIPCLTEASFRWPKRIAASAWTEHVPFAFWLIEAVRPLRLVELGTYTGVSFFAFCEAAAEAGLAGDFHAVDTWTGDPQSGFYAESVFDDVARWAATEHPDRAHLHRATFDAAADGFADGSVDLLHIDGCHTYEAVRHDYETWRPKLSAHGVVVFHDTRVERDDFGVIRLWAELAAAHPGFEFHHGHGLGILAPGEDVPEGLRPLLRLDEAARERVRTAYARLGAGVAADYRAETAERQRKRLAAAARSEPAPASPSATDEPARGLYLDLMVRTVSNMIYGDADQTPGAQPRFVPGRRLEGRDWPAAAHSMIGVKRLNNLRNLCERVILDGIPGDFIETGVWRGGACILMRAVLAAHGDSERIVWCADSFDGLPPPDPERHPQDAGDRHHEFRQLAVPVDEVRRNFARYGLLDDQVRFVEGLFADTLPPPNATTFAIVRLDGDMYGSTIDAISRLYDRLNPGGFVIVDDYGAVEGCRMAIEDFRRDQGITSPLSRIDWTGVWWRKSA